MHWDGYTVFSVISGVIMLLAAVVVPGLAGKDRAKIALGGLILGGYGVYVAKQTSGTFFFSPIIFIIPFAAVAWVCYQVYQSRQQIDR